MCSVTSCTDPSLRRAFIRMIPLSPSAWKFCSNTPLTVTEESDSIADILTPVTTDGYNRKTETGSSLTLIKSGLIIPEGMLIIATPKSLAEMTFPAISIGPIVSNSTR